jgi:predicted metal-binding protein
MQLQELMDKALEMGFSEVTPIDCATLELRDDVRDSCVKNACGKYGTNWTCPPACGTLEECKERIRPYKRGFIAITVGDIEDSFDFDSIREVSLRHGENMVKYSRWLIDNCPGAIPLGAGPCGFCKDCNYPEPCRFPKNRIIAMEALGLLVGDVCKKNGALYYHGPEKQAFFGCFLTE